MTGGMIALCFSVGWAKTLITRKLLPSPLKEVETLTLAGAADHRIR
jgi:hypothetical protein